MFHCAIGSKCLRFKVTVAKKTVSTSLCPHERIATLLSGRCERSVEIPSEQAVSKPSANFNESQWMANTSEYLYQNQKLDLSKLKKKEVEKRILEINSKGWPKLFEPSLEKCPCCSAKLAPPVKHQGK